MIYGKEEKWQPLTGYRRGCLRVLPREAADKEEKPTSLNTDIYVRDRADNTIHRVGDDRHDSLWVDESGTVHYSNLQNGDGCGAYSIKDKMAGYEFCPSEYGRIDKDYAEKFNQATEETSVCDDPDAEDET